MSNELSLGTNLINNNDCLRFGQLCSNVLGIRDNQSVYTSAQFGFFGVIFWEDSHSTSTCCHGDQTVWLVKVYSQYTAMVPD